jgi:NAD(P)H dehydrogenase (quinone)
MNVLIVYAHHEPTSFCAAMLQTATDALEAGGHTVVVSNLYTMEFDPVSDRRNFNTVFDPARLHQQAEEAHAQREGGFAPALRTEMDKLIACDLLVFLFPIWWLGLPAILKGWVDRVLAVGVAYGGGRYFDSGAMRGKRAMCVVSTGGLPAAYDGSGHYAAIDTVSTRCTAASSCSPGSRCCSPSSRTAPTASATASAHRFSRPCAPASLTSPPIRSPPSNRPEPIGNTTVDAGRVRDVIVPSAFAPAGA